MTSGVKNSSYSMDELGPIEIFWRDLQPWLFAHGFQLRPRFRPGWQPPWYSKGGHPLEYEEGYAFYGDNIMDAVQVSTGRLVALKKLPHEQEEELNEIILPEIWSREPLLHEPDNHCAPVLAVLQHDKEPFTILVTPFLIRWDKPRFNSVAEGLDFVRQILEGLRFLHRNRLAHRDIKNNNVMMEPTRTFPDGFHPNRFGLKSDASGLTRRISRTDASPKYFFIDFGHTCHYPSEDAPLVQPLFGGDRSVPEFQGDGWTRLHNPFLTDIYYAGNLLRGTFTSGHPDADLERPGTYSFGFLVSMIKDMTRDDPARRPNIEDLVTRFADVEKRVGWFKQRSRVKYRDESWFLIPIRSAIHWSRIGSRLLKSKPTVPEYYRTHH